METIKLICLVAAIISSNAKTNDSDAIIKLINTSWNAYLNMNKTEYIGYFDNDISRMSTRATGIQYGKEAISEQITNEWQAFERPDGKITEEMNATNVEITVDNPEQPQFAFVRYWMQTKGGTRWKYEDMAYIFQIFKKQGDDWVIYHQSDSWSLNFDLDKNQPNTEATAFDYVYPVKDLHRAIKFYTPILGKPEAVTDSRAYFNLGGVRYIIDTNSLNGIATIKESLPAGYAIFYSNDIDAEYERLKKSGVKLLPDIYASGADKYFVGFDPAGNAFVMWQKNHVLVENVATSEIIGFDDSNYGKAAKKYATAWLSGKAENISAYYDANSLYFDDTHHKNLGVERGNPKILAALPEFYWNNYDAGNSGLAIKMDVSNFKVKALNSKTLVTYQMHLTGLGTHPFQEKSLVTHLFNDENKIEQTFISEFNQSQAMAVELDYTGYPVTDLSEAKKFYREILHFDDGYADEDYYGFWSNNAVFGLYLADPETDGLPIKKRSNGYVSFWIRSADETYQYLKEQASSFPVIPAINDKSGIDEQSGYRQIVTNDSEGSLLIFTEYTGRSR